MLWAPSPQPSPRGRGGSEGRAACPGYPHPNPLPEGEGVGRAGCLPWAPSPQPSPRGRGGRRAGCLPWAPSPQPSPRGRGGGGRLLALCSLTQPSPRGRGGRRDRRVRTGAGVFHQAWIRPGTVYSRATTSTTRPRLHAASLVMGADASHPDTGSRGLGVRRFEQIHESVDRARTRERDPVHLLEESAPAAGRRAERARCGRLPPPSPSRPIGGGSRGARPGLPPPALAGSGGPAPDPGQGRPGCPRRETPRGPG